MGVQKIDLNELKSIPVLFGEKDVLKTIQLLPGIKSAGEGSSGFNVRGGASDQNLILLDEATVYNASHLMGFFSVFNSDAIKDAAVYKGNEPAEYGGRLSSVLDIKTNDGNDKKFGVSGGIGLISIEANDTEQWTDLSFIPRMHEWFNLQNILKPDEIEIIKQSALLLILIWLMFIELSLKSKGETTG